MNIFVTGTDTNVGKTIVCSWLCLKTGYDYFKPIQTGVCEGSDSEVVAQHTNAYIHPEIYRYKAPLSPHAASCLEDEVIVPSLIQLPLAQNLIIEGAGGVLVPINDEMLMVDLIKQFNASVILVVLSRLGMINHTLLSLEALRARKLHVLGIIVTGDANTSSIDAICRHGCVSVLGHIPWLPEINETTLQSVPCDPVLLSMIKKGDDCELS
jgi:dethiobiotin synthetase